MDTCLITDTAIDGHTSFHTTLQVITSQGSKPLHIKVVLGASCSSISLSHFHKAFPKYFTKSGSLKKRALKPTWMTLVSPWWIMSKFFRIHRTRHPTQDPFPSSTLKFYIFKYFTSPEILLSYPTSLPWGIVEFTVPKKAPINFPTMKDTITSPKTVTLSPHIEDIPQKPHNTSDCKVKPNIKQPFQDHITPVTPSQDHLLAPFQTINSP